ncbi:DUF6520 family protein [Flavobacterium taihuense]|uniref:Uncharacterized protein n=1 Tax=Flavobacterium taihuense TaxID=2857508 RepID=A0ABS6XWN1_9FLAO|nr:DUF6520 family protein [Flavobacterium taihuense]MBW4361047.1 hypothetical protein [Flavobacterium taihuense]
MKTTFLNLVMPMAAVAVGLAGALTTNAMEKSNSKLAPVMGYKHVSVAIPCQQVQLCSNNGTFVCTSDIDGANLYAKPGTTCPNQLFRDTQ